MQITPKCVMCSLFGVINTFFVILWSRIPAQVCMTTIRRSDSNNLHFREKLCTDPNILETPLTDKYQAKLPESMIVKTELWKKWIKKLFILTFLFGNIFSSGQKYHSCPTRKSLKNAKIKSEHQNSRNELKISFGW